MDVNIRLCARFTECCASALPKLIVSLQARLLLVVHRCSDGTYELVGHVDDEALEKPRSINLAVGGWSR